MTFPKQPRLCAQRLHFLRPRKLNLTWILGRIGQRPYDYEEMAVEQGGNPWSAQPVLTDTGGSAFHCGGFVTAGLDDSCCKLDRYAISVCSMANGRLSSALLRQLAFPIRVSS